MTVFRLHLPVTMFVFGVVVVVLFLFAVPYSIPRDLYTISRVISHVIRDVDLLPDLSSIFDYIRPSSTSPPHK